MRIKSILVIVLTILIVGNGSFAKDKNRINDLKSQLSDILNCTFISGDYRESMFVSLKGTGTNQIIIYKTVNDYESGLDKILKYKVKFTDIEKVAYFDIKGNKKNACGIKIHLKKPSTYTIIQHSPHFAKVKRTCFNIVIQSSGKRTDIKKATYILTDLVAEYE